MRPLVLALALLSVGCTTAGPNVYLLYAKGNYYYGRMEAKTELLCTPSPTVQLRVTADQLSDYCKEAKATREIIKATVPIIEAEMQKQKPDWAKIMQYLDLVLSLASKAI